MSENMNVEASAIAVRKNGKWFVGGGSGGTTIHYYDSLDQVPADLPEGSFVAVPSNGAGGGGLPVVELTTLIQEGQNVLTEEEGAAITAAIAIGTPILIKFPIDGGMFDIPCGIIHLEGVSMYGGMLPLVGLGIVQINVGVVEGNAVATYVTQSTE